MSRRNKIIIGAAIAVAVIVIGLLIWWWLTRVTPSGLTPGLNTNAGLQIPANLPGAAANLPSVPDGPVKQADLEADLKATARIFAERFGSYSNESNYANFDTLADLVTPKLKSELEAQKAGLAAAGNVYRGITTKALAAEITTYDATLGQAEITVVTQRQEAEGSSSNLSVYYQSLNLKLSRNANAWKIDQAVWAARP